MTGTELESIRTGLAMTRAEFGRALGYGGDDHTKHQTVKRYEMGERDIPEWIATRARALDTDGLLEFIQLCARSGLQDQADFVRRLSAHLTGRIFQ